MRGDGYVLAGVEECDDGNISNTDECVDGCKLATCGDGFIQEDKEECDDGNDVDTDTCPLLLQARLLRRRLRPAGRLRSATTATRRNTDALHQRLQGRRLRADGYVHGDEACDDGNTDDACSGDCAASRRFVTTSRLTSTTSNLFVTAAPTRSAASAVRRPSTTLGGRCPRRRWSSSPGGASRPGSATTPRARALASSAKLEGFGGTYVMIDSTKRRSS
ncbi:MAG: DUF4215 domain-containing protein [Myxococcales bacterium]|nr:DUF4215 domain-containing protein [Myxococcales bacterium]